MLEFLEFKHFIERLICAKYLTRVWLLFIKKCDNVTLIYFENQSTYANLLKVLFISFASEHSRFRKIIWKFGKNQFGKEIFIKTC